MELEHLNLIKLNSTSIVLKQLKFSIRLVWPYSVYLKGEKVESKGVC